MLACALTAVADKGSLSLVPSVRECVEGNGSYRLVLDVGWKGSDWYDFDAVGRALCQARIVRRNDGALPAEGYSLNVTTSGVEISSSDAAGAFYAEQTLRQLATIENSNVVSFACVTVRDWPQYRWRGVLLDEARHFLGKVAVKRVLETMARHKMNVLHWHLTDDQGWRLDVPGHPALVKYGARRRQSVVFGSHARWLPPRYETQYEYDGVPYGPYYYDGDDIREILAYAKARHVMVVPEIEVPGHMRAFLAAYPECSCVGPGLPRESRCGWSIDDDVLCVGNDDAVNRYLDVLDGVCKMFPDASYIHIGGDECRRGRWKACESCQRRLREIGEESEDALQAWITTKVVRHLEGVGRRVVGWDEVLAGNVPTSTVGMTWRSEASGGAGTAFVSAATAVRRGHDMIMTPAEFCYLDMPQGLLNDPFPYYAPWTAPITLEKAYAFDPCAGIPESDRFHVVGGQASIWGECVHNVCDLEWKLWPRGCALAEVLWLGADKPGFEDFARRMTVHLNRMRTWNVIFAPLD